MKKKRAPITTHILDLGRGAPARGVPVAAEKRSRDGDWKRIGRGVTDADGRIEDLIPVATKLTPGVYRLVFEVEAYFESERSANGDSFGAECFYPSITVAFRVREAGRHHHIPLLLNAYGYSTYRGT